MIKYKATMLLEQILQDTLLQFAHSQIFMGLSSNSEHTSDEKII